MSELAPAKVRVEVFREPGFFDDNFAKGWVTISGASVSDGDQEIIFGLGDVGRVEKDVSPNLSITTYKQIIVRVTAVYGVGTKWGVQVYLLGVGWVTVWTGQTGTGVFELQMGSGQTITKIALLEEYAGDVSNRVYFDYVAICKGSLLVPDLGELVEKLTVTRPLLNQGIAGAKISVPNFAGAYNGLIKAQDAILIWLARSEANLGVPAYKVFGGRVVALTNRGERYGEFYVDLDCHGHAYELNIPPALLQKYYAGTNGRVIIEDALALCSYLTKHPLASLWFDNTGSFGNTDDQINSTHNIVYDEELPITVIQEILEKAKNPAAVQGFDAYETPSGCVVGHLRNSLDFVSPIASITPRSYQKSEDLHRVRNKIKVYGKKGRPWSGSVSKDGWTESASGWGSNQGTPETSTDTPNVGIGTVSIQINAGTSTNANLYRTWASFSSKFSREKRKISFYFKALVAGANPYRINILIYAPDINNCFRLFDVKIPDQEWHEYAYDIGPGTIWESNKFGNPDWSNVSGIFITHQTSPAYPTSHIIRVDLLHFVDTYSGSASDSSSQDICGVRCNEPEVDEALNSDAECQAKAESILATLKDPVITLSDVIVDGDHRYTPGDRQRVVVANDGLDAYFRIVQVKHSVQRTQWDTVLTLSNEPQYIDYIFRLLQETTKLLERRS